MSDVTQRQHKIVEFLKNNEPISVKKINDGLNKEISERSLRRDLSELKEKGLVTKVGSGPNTLWTVSKK